MHLLANVVLPWYDDKIDLEQLMSVVPRGSRKTIYICKTDVGMHKSLKNDAKIWCLHRAMSLIIWFRVLKQTCYKIWMKNN